MLVVSDPKMCSPLSRARVGSCVAGQWMALSILL